MNGTTGQVADARFVAVAESTLDDWLGRHPVAASELGEHRFDDRLDDESPAALDDEARAVGRHLAALDAIDTELLSVHNLVDAEILRARLAARLFELEQLRSHTWDPLHANPGTALYVLLARDFAPVGERLRSLAGRLRAVPQSLAVAREHLAGPLPLVHVETAITQFAGTVALLGTAVERALAEEPALRGEVEPARAAALEALHAHLAWLRSRADAADRDPRLGPELFAAKLWHTLDTPLGADDVLVRAEADLLRIEAEIAEVAAAIEGGPSGGPGVVRRALDRMADEHPDDDTILDLAAAALASTTAFVTEEQLVTVPDDPVEVIAMPEIHRGVAVAYCDPPGPLEQAALTTYFAISPTPEGWPPERVTSFYREYNNHMIRNLTVHEAMPGHVLQLAHARRHVADTRVRRAFWSGPFVEGWAVYAEQLMAERGYAGAALRLQQLKMQLRTTINAILDIRVHAHGMTEDEAMALMTGRGHQEEGEAVGKWRRAQLTSAQLSTYYVGFLGVRDVVARARRAWPSASLRDVHDRVLAHGSPPPRHLPALLGFAEV